MCCQDARMSEIRTASSSLVSAEELAGSCCVVGGDRQSVDTGYVSYTTRSLYVYTFIVLLRQISGFSCRNKNHLDFVLM